MRDCDYFKILIKMYLPSIFNYIYIFVFPGLEDCVVSFSILNSQPWEKYEISK